MFHSWLKYSANSGDLIAILINALANIEAYIDFPDEDLIVLDEDSSGAISSEEFISFFSDGTDVLQYFDAT